MRGIVIADFFQFAVILIGSLAAAVFAVRLPQVNGVANLFTHPDIVPKLRFLPDFADTDLLVSVFIIPVAIQWWKSGIRGRNPAAAAISRSACSRPRTSGSRGGLAVFQCRALRLRPLALVYCRFLLTAGLS
jgi:hypothetical protein